MKKVLIVCITAMLALLTLSASAEMPDGIVLDEEYTTSSIPSGYPRFETLSDGTLLLVNSGTVRKSTDNGESWNRKDISTHAKTTVTTASGTTHELSRENWQGFVCKDGTVIAAYRSRTKNYVSGEFYTSIRFMTSTDGAETFTEEVIVAEQTASSMNGFWEPFMIQTDDDTVLIYYSDDLNVTNPAQQQNIVYHEYNLTTKEVSEAKVAIDGVSRNSRDGMPVVTALRHGGYAMVIEAHDYANRFYGGLNYYKCVFVIGLSLSADGKTWSAPIPVVAPHDLTAGSRCAAPFITTLPDGRVLISYMTEDDYVGAKTATEPHKHCVYGAVISDDVLTLETALTASKGGPSTGFTELPDLFEDPETGYMIWNTVFSSGRYLYFAGSSGTNDGTVASAVQIRRAETSPLGDLDRDGSVSLKDTLLALKAIGRTSELYKYDVNNDAKVSLADALSILKTSLN